MRLGFKQFLAEAIKSRFAAAKRVLKHPADNPSFDQDQIHTGDFIRHNAMEQHYAPDFASRNARFYKVRNVPIHTVITPQDTVDRHVVAQKVLGTWNKEYTGENRKYRHTPRIPVFVKLPDGRHWLADGNHRAVMRAARGFTHIRGLVIDHHHAEMPEDQIKSSNRQG